MAHISRRMMLISGGATAVVIAGVGGMAWWPGAASATQPWREAGLSLGDPRLDALAYAILAPNPHNRQPWRFTLVGDDQIDIGCDLDRRLPVTDPFDRQIVIGMGCMIELLVLAAAAQGWACEIALWPDGEPQPRLDNRRVAQVTFARAAGVAADPLAALIPLRRSTKTVYAAQPVAPARLAMLIDPAVREGVVAGGTVAADDVAALRALTWDAWMIEYRDAAMRRESIDLMRIGNAEVAANPDGIELGGVQMGLFGMTGLVTRAALDTPGTSAYAQGIAMFEPILQSAQGFIWLVTPTNDRKAQLAAGRRWVRMNLQAEALGIAVHPLSQALQEARAMAAPYAAVHQRLGAQGGAVVQMLGRIGYADAPAPTPRWPLRSRLVAA